MVSLRSNNPEPRMSAQGRYCDMAGLFHVRYAPESGGRLGSQPLSSRARTGSVNLHSTTASAHRRTLHVRANGQRACVELLQFSDGCIEVEWTDVTDNQLPNACVSGDATDDRRRRV